MKEEDHDADEPHVGEIAEHDEESAQTVMQRVFVKIALSANENVGEEPADVLAELQHIVISQFIGGFLKGEKIFVHVERVSLAAEPAGHEGSGKQQKISPNCHWQVV